ncbi:hypothetical protein BH09CHL1_BH09CHL1_10930 [soil metagenome]
MTSVDPIRMPLLLKLAEQAMSDLDFRAVARLDLERALADFGYELNARELGLVLRFRQALAEAGIDLSLTDQFSMEDIDLLRDLGEEILEQEQSSADR